MGGTTMKCAILLFAFSLSMTAVVSAQTAPAACAQPNTVYAGADGKFDAAPDTAMVQFTISAQADSAKGAYDQAGAQAEQVRQIMRNNGFDPKSAEIGFYSIQPQYDWKNPKRKLIGYQVSTSVTLKVKDFAKIGPITQQLADANVSTSQSVTYTLDNMEEAKGKAVADAYRKARMSADAVAHAGSRTLGDMMYASVDTFENIRPMVMGGMQMKMAAAAPGPTEEFTPQTVNVTAHVNAMFALK
jgi:uncharacterized protein